MPIRLIHVGLGVRGHHWLDIVRDYPDAVSVAGVDPDRRALASARRHTGGAAVRFYVDLETALREVEADAALVASPSVFHPEHAVQVLRSGLHVMVEKPFAASVKEALGVIEAAEAAGRHVMVAENYRFFPAERTVRRWVREGRLGTVTTVTCRDRRNQPPGDLGPWASSLPYPQLVEIAVHHFDSIRALTGRRPVSVTARVVNPPGSAYRRGGATDAMIELDGGITAVYSGSLCCDRYEFALTVEGEAGVLWTDRRRVWWRQRGARFFRPVRTDDPAGDGHRYPRAGTRALLDHLRDAVLHGREPETAGRDNVWTVAMLEAAARSAEEMHAVSVADVDGLPALGRPAAAA
jgi:predicted dehydrogenase